MKKSLFILGPAVFLLTACGGSGLDPQAALPGDADMYFVLDFDGGDARGQFDEVMSRFPQDGALNDAFGAGLVSADIPAKDLSKIIKDDFELAMAVNIRGVETADVYLAARLDKADKLFDLIQFDEEFWTEEQDGNFEYMLGLDSFILKNKDLIVFSNDLGGREALQTRLESGEGFDGSELSERAAELVEAPVGYMYVSEEMVNNPILEQMGLDLNAFGDSLTAVAATAEGFEFVSESTVAGGEDALNEIYPNFAESLRFVDRVNAEGVFMYQEGYGLGMGLKSGLSSLPESGVEFEGVDFDKWGPMLDGAFAMAASSKGGLLPSIELYLQLDDGGVEPANELVTMVDGYVEQLLAMITASLSLSEEAGFEGLIKKDVAVVKGGALHKVYLDVEALAADASGQMAMLGGVLKGQKIELYYGVTGDNVLVFAFTPDLPARYGVNVLSEDDDFLSVTKDYLDSFTLAYFRSAPLVQYLGQMKNFAQLTGAGSEELAVFNEILVWIGTVETGVSASLFEDGKIKGLGNLRIKELE